MNKIIPYFFIMLSSIIGCAQNIYEQADRKVSLVSDVPDGTKCKLMGSQRQARIVISSLSSQLELFKKEAAYKMKVAALEKEANFLIMTQIERPCSEGTACAIYEGKFYKCE
jgi:hypothetical protein